MTEVTWPATDANGQARAAASAAFAVNDDFLFRSVDYVSRGRTLVVGPAARVDEMIAELGESPLAISVLVTDGVRAAAAEERDGVEVYLASVKSIGGHLGAWTVQVTRDDRELDLGEVVHGEAAPHFDLLFDLQQPRALSAQTAALGYFTPSDSVAMSAAISAAGELVGEFQKPRFFNYNPDICAHGRAGITGCTRCIDACPTDAIISIGEQIEVDAYLCQGGGVCASTCPSGAMTYAYPPMADSLSAIRSGLIAYREAGGESACLLIHDEEDGLAAVAQAAASLPENCIAFSVEESATLGLDAWLAALAWGADTIRILITAATPPSVVSALREQCETASALLQFAGHDAQRVGLISTNELDAFANDVGNNPSPAAGFAPVDDKRSMIRMAFDHIAAGADITAEVELPKHAAFGEIVIDTQACTLCMSCASVCPTAAITPGGESPALRFTEWNCVQCGTCESACPENAISLHARYLMDNDRRMSTRTLHEEAPFDCVKCGKPFATASVMQRMQEKLKDHWMFQNPEQRRRLQMCEDCRVTDLYAAEGGLTIRPPAGENN